jgi:SAM-dependent methyltransferase
MDAYWEVINGFDRMIALESVHEVGVFEKLLHGAKTAEALALATGTAPARLIPFLDMVAQMGFLKRLEDGYELMAGDAPLFDPSGPFAGGLGTGGLARFTEKRGKAVEVLRTDTPMKSAATGDDVPGSEREAFLEHIHVNSIETANEVARLIENSGIRRIADLGCGGGTYTYALLKACPDATAVMLDRPNAGEFIEKKLVEEGLSGRATFVGGDMLTAHIGEGFDLVLLSQVIHNFGLADNRALVHRVSAALAPGGQVAVVDADVAHDRSGPEETIQFAMVLAILSQSGAVYSEEEVVSWMEAAGLSHRITYGLRTRRDNYLVLGQGV